MKLLGRPLPRRPGPMVGAGRRQARRGRTWRVVRLVALAAAALMVVTAAIGYSSNKLRRRKTYMTTAELTDAVLRFHHDFLRYPDSLEQLLRPPADQPAYLDVIPRDAWGGAFRYERVIDPPPGSFRVLSDGPDGEPGTGDDIENL